MAVLELVLCLPILILPVLAIAYFGLYYARMEQLALACRVGAREASQTAALASTNDGDPVPANILDAIDATLATAGMKRCKVRVEHNVGSGQVALVSPTSGACAGGPTTNLRSPPPGMYVRVTVCVAKSELVPRCLSGFGLSICGDSDVVAANCVFLFGASP